MKNLKFLSLTLSTLLIFAFTSGCGAKANDMMAPGDADDYVDYEGMEGIREESGADADDAEGALIENPFISADANPISTFSADVDTASYAYFRKLTEQGYTPEGLKKQFKSSPLRTEEMVNYFDYSYTLPKSGEVFGIETVIAPTPWNQSSHLLMLGLATEKASEKLPNNLVFLIDVSGSMSSSDKLPLLKKAFGNLVSALDEKDTVSVVTYSGREDTVLSGCPGNRDEEIMNAINGLEASGSTNGEAGLTRAYSLARDYFKENGNNRIILASDGDLNVGISSPEELKNYISEKRNEGIFLSVLGFGTGNYKDSAMSALAQNGNGVYYYIDGEREAEKVLGEDILSTLYTVAKDVKLQLTFDPAYVSMYRLIGYENRMLNTEDFEDDTKDAGEVGAGHSVTVCYELILAENALEKNNDPATFATLGIRYKLPKESESTMKEYLITDEAVTDTPDGDFKFAAAVIEASMILNGSKFNADKVTLSDALALAKGANVTNDEYKQEFCNIIAALAGQESNVNKST